MHRPSYNELVYGYALDGSVVDVVFDSLNSNMVSVQHSLLSGGDVFSATQIGSITLPSSATAILGIAQAQSVGEREFRQYAMTFEAVVSGLEVVPVCGVHVSPTRTRVTSWLPIHFRDPNYCTSSGTLKPHDTNATNDLFTLGFFFKNRTGSQVVTDYRMSISSTRFATGDYIDMVVAR